MFWAFPDGASDWLTNIRQRKASARLPVLGSHLESTNWQNLGTEAFKLTTTNARFWEMPAA